MSRYHAVASMLRVDRADDCVWLVDERGEGAQSIHLTSDQATEAGEALLEAGAGMGDSLTIQIGDENGALAAAVRTSARPGKPVPVDRDVDIAGVPLVTCPRCKGHGGIFLTDEGESCNLCDGHGEVYDHGGGAYSNDTDRNTYMY